MEDTGETGGQGAENVGAEAGHLDVTGDIRTGAQDQDRGRGQDLVNGKENKVIGFIRDRCRNQDQGHH